MRVDLHIDFLGGARCRTGDKPTHTIRLNFVVENIYDISPVDYGLSAVISRHSDAPARIARLEITGGNFHINRVGGKEERRTGIETREGRNAPAYATLRSRNFSGRKRSISFSPFTLYSYGTVSRFLRISRFFPQRCTAYLHTSNFIVIGYKSYSIILTVQTKYAHVCAVCEIF